MTQPPTKPASGQRCAICGYDLSATAEGDPCPECATNSTFSRLGPWLRHRPVYYVNALRTSARTAAVGWAIAGCSLVLILLGAAANAVGSPLLLLPGWGGIVLWAIGCIGLCAADPYPGDRRLARALRGRLPRVARWVATAVVVLCVAFALSVLVAWTYWQVGIFAMLLAWVLFFLVVTLTILQFFLIASIARRADDQRLTRRATRVGLIGVGAVIGCWVLGVVSASLGSGVISFTVFLLGCVGTTAFPIYFLAGLSGALGRVRPLVMLESVLGPEGVAPATAPGRSNRRATTISRYDILESAPESTGTVSGTDASEAR